MDVWGKLWDVATSEEGDPATITLDPESADVVTLTWPDGSKATYEWYDGDWRCCEEPSYMRNASTAVGGEGE